MDFYAVLDQALALLRQRGRVSYRTLKRQFDLDDAYLDDLKMELIEVHQCARDQDGTMLVWTGEAVSPPVPAAPEPAGIPAPAPLAYTPPYLAEKILTSWSALEGKRKQVTVLFADLKGSTELIAGLDPEEARRLLDPALHVMMDAVHRYQGTVNQVLGDGIMALFGAPVAHEDHAGRACYASLAMQAAMRRYAEEIRRTHGLEVQIRVGLHSGEVVVRAIGNDLHMDYSAVGQTTHLAARMEQLALPGSIRLTGGTLRLAEGLVQVTALGPVPVKGLPEPVEVFELRGATAIRRRFQAAAARGLTRFVGRQTELEALHQALVRAGAGQVQAAQCDFRLWFAFKGTNIYHNTAQTAYLYTTDHSRIDVDSAPNAYHPTDVGKDCRNDSHIGLDCPANAGYGRRKEPWWPKVLVADRNDPSRAYEQQTGEFKGFLVAMTWLTGGRNLPATDSAKYVDARHIPYLVFPGSNFAQLPGTGSKGDVGFAWHLDNGKQTSFIVADQGGGDKARLGEGSGALYEALGGTDVNARTGAGVAPGRVRFVLFPGSRKAINVQQSWPLTTEMIERIAAERLASLGSEAALEACGDLS